MVSRAPNFAELIRHRVAPKVYLPAWMDRIASMGIVSADPLVVRRQRLTNLFSFFSIFNAAAVMLVVAVQHGGPLLSAHAPIMVMIGVALLIPWMHRAGDNLGAHAIAAIDIFGTLWLAFAYGRNSQIYMYYSLTSVLLLVFGVENWRRYLPWFAISGLSLLASLTLAPAEGLFVNASPSVAAVTGAQTLFNSVLVLSIVVFFALSTLRRAEVEIEEQNVRANLLVEAVFPPSVVTRLTSGREEKIADRIGSLTVLFADLVGFTEAAHDLPPDEVIAYLDDMVRGFDRLATSHGVEKVKTIGDCYMAAGGLNGDARSQAVAVGRLALAMIGLQETRPPLNGRKLQLRAGIHTGEATAGVIGDTRFTYDVWGDAVNTASRMESHGLPNRVQVSEAWIAIAGDAFVLEDRGAISIKSLGLAKTYLLVEALPSASVPADSRLRPAEAPYGRAAKG